MAVAGGGGPVNLGSLGRFFVALVEMLRFASAVLIVALFSGVELSAAEEVGPTGFTTAQLVQFATEFRSAVEADSPEIVAKFIQFPLRVNTGPGRFHLLGKERFMTEYRKVFTETVRSAVLNQDLDSLHESWRGTMFGR